MKKLENAIGIGCVFFSVALCMNSAAKLDEEKKEEAVRHLEKNNDTGIAETEKKEEERPAPKQAKLNLNTEIVQKTFQADSPPAIKNPIKQTEKKSVSSAVVPEQNCIELAVYPNNYCVINDRRILRVKRGVNRIRFEDIIPCDPKSITLRTPNKGKIVVQHYHYNAPVNSFDELMMKSAGEKISYGKDEVKLLCCIPHEKSQVLITEIDKDSCATLPNTVPMYKIDSKAIKSMNSLDVVFESKNSEDIEIELSYAVPKITQEHAYDVDVFEKLDRVDVCSKCILNNTTSMGIKNASVVVKREVFADNTDGGINISGVRREVKIPDVDLPKHAETVCSFYQKNIEHSVTYRVKISQDDLEFPNHEAQEKNLAISNLITLENMGQNVVRSKNFENSSVNVYYRQRESRDLCGRFKLSDMQKYGNDWKLEIGETSGITAKYQRTDRNSTAKNQCEYGFKISLQNNKLEDASVNFAVDMDAGKYKILRSNADPQSNGEWIIPLKANEKKELQVRIRVNRQ